MGRLLDFYATQLRVLWEWKGGRVALLKRLAITLVVATILLLVIVVPGFLLLYTLDQRTLLPEEGADGELAATAAEAPVSGP